jgi:hypothetical protein
MVSGERLICSLEPQRSKEAKTTRLGAANDVALRMSQGARRAQN